MKRNIKKHLKDYVIFFIATTKPKDMAYKINLESNESAVISDAPTRNFEV